MGHRKHNAPRRGSLAFLPRGRTRSIIPRVKYVDYAEKEPNLGAILTFKVGMAHMISMDDRKRIPNYGKPLFVPFTLVALPKIRIYGVRIYKKEYGSLVIHKDLLNYKDQNIFKKPLEKEEEKIEGEFSEVRVLGYIIPNEIGVSAKKPILIEIPIVGGNNDKRLEFAKSLLGKDINSAELLKNWSYIDVFGVTKGKGIQGPVTRQGIKRKQHKSRKSVRAVGVLGAWHPHDVTYTVPRAGQMGYHRRPLLNLRVLKVLNSKTNPINPKSGFNKFGIIDGDYAIIKGSLPGPAKRPVLIRKAVRKKNIIKELKAVAISIEGAKIDA